MKAVAASSRTSCSLARRRARAALTVFLASRVADRVRKPRNRDWVTLSSRPRGVRIWSVLPVRVLLKVPARLMSLLISTSGRQLPRAWGTRSSVARREARSAPRPGLFMYAAAKADSRVWANTADGIPASTIRTTGMRKIMRPPTFKRVLPHRDSKVKELDTRAKVNKSLVCLGYAGF